MSRSLKPALFAVLAVGLGSSACAREPKPPLGETCSSPAECGLETPLVPMPVPAVHAGLVWSEDSWEQPKLLFWTRHANMRGTDLVEAGCLEALILGAYSSWPISSFEWMFSVFFAVEHDLSDPFKDADPGPVAPGYSFNQCLRSSFKQLITGGYRLRQGLSQSVPQRIRTYLDRELAQTWSLGHPDAFDHSGSFYTTYIDEADAYRTLASFTDAGYSRHLSYNIYGAGHSTLADGRVAAFGGHNMNSHNGYRKVNIYDPNTGNWELRPDPCLRENWEDDRYGRELGYLETWEDRVNPPAEAPAWPGCDPRLRDDTDPPTPSDMRYPRWSPSSIILPNGTVLILGGSDQDESVAPALDLADKDARDAAFRATRVHQAVPEIFDPQTGTTTALENARRRFPLSPQASVVQTGPGVDDWQVCALGGLPAPAGEASTPREAATNPAAEWRRYCEEPGCEADERAIRFMGPYSAASVDCLDVQAALADPDRNLPGEAHWTHVATAADAHDRCCPMANLIELDAEGKITRHEWIVFGGRQPAGEPTATIAGLDWADAEPQWRKLGELYQPSEGADAVALPDGTVLITGGRVGARHEDGETELPLGRRWNLRYQIFDPDTDELRTVARTTVPRGLHGTSVLLPDATVAVMGHDRHQLVKAGSAAFPPGDADLGVSNAALYYPPYLFDADGQLAERPELLGGPDAIGYGGAFVLEVGEGEAIASVALIRAGFVTHSLDTGGRYLRLVHAQDGTKLSVRAPRTAAQALPGDYMLFVVDEQGVPGHARHLRLGA